MAPSDDSGKGKLNWGRRVAQERHVAGWGVVGILAVVVLAISAISVWNAFQWKGKTFPGFLLNQRLAVGIIGQSNWSGIQAGLKYPDRILQANGRPILSDRDIEEVLGASPPGTPVIYTVERNGKTIEVSVPTMRFSGTDLFMTFGVIFLQAMVYFLLAIVVFILKPGTGTSWAFLAACLIQSVSDILSFDIESTHFGFIRLYLALNALLPAAIFQLSLSFPEPSRFAEKRQYLVYAPYGISLVMAVLMAVLYPSPLAVSIYKFVLLLITVSVGALVAATAVSFFRRSSALARQRAKVVLIGAVIALPVTAAFSLVASLGISVSGLNILTNFTAVPMLAFPAAIGYAIARHNLFDVDVFIKRAVGYVIMTVIVGAGYFALQVALESLVLKPVFGEEGREVTPFLFSVMVVFLFNPLNRRIQAAVDRLFYRTKFDYKTTVTAVSDALSSVLNLDEIVRKIVHTIHEEMFIDRSGLVLAAGQGGGYPAYFLDGESDNGSEVIRSSILPADDPLVALVRRGKRLVTKYDVAEDPHYAEVRESCGNRFEELGAALAVPLVYQDEVKAVLAVGHKKSGQFFNREDIDLLQTLASHGAVAIENANMAEQMRKEETVRTNLSRYLSPQIVDRIVQNDVQVNLGGDRRVVTVLFSDIRNFTTITETRPPEQLVHILNEYFTEMAQIIFEHQGSLDKYIGDAIVAVFGSLIPLENPAKNAVAAAVSMMTRLPELNRRWETRYDFCMDIGIGVNTGEVFLGNIGSPERMEFTVIGDAVNVASRFSGLAKAGQVLVTKETFAHLGTDFQVREHPPAEVKGKSGKLEVFEILHARSAI